MIPLGSRATVAVPALSPPTNEHETALRHFLSLLAVGALLGPGSRSAAAAPVELTAGATAGPTHYQKGPGYRVGARLSLVNGEGLGLATGLLVRPDRGTKDLSDLTNTLVNIAHEGAEGVEFVQPVEKEVVAASCAVDWTLGSPLVREPLAGGVRVYAGAQAGLVNRYLGKPNESTYTTRLTNNGAQLSVGPVLGASFVGWASERVGLRAGWGYRAFLLSGPQYSPSKEPDGLYLSGRWAANADLIVALGER